MAAPTGVIVIGGSAGSVEVLLRLVSSLGPDLPAAVLVAVHSGPYSVLADLLHGRGSLPAAPAKDGERLLAGRIYVSPPDMHLLVGDGVARVSGGPKENGFRPSVDALFRTAARAYGSRAIAVVLSGSLDCGAAGLKVVRAMGGAGVVQDPKEALFPDMPRHAIAAAGPDFVLPAAEIPAKLTELAARLAGPKRAGRDAPSSGRLTGLSCPECHGTLSEGPAGFRCHVGHAFSATALSAEQGRDLEGALWSAVRALRESETLARRFSKTADRRIAGRHRQRADALGRSAELISELLLSPSIRPVETPPRVPGGPVKPRRRRPNDPRARMTR